MKNFSKMLSLAVSLVGFAAQAQLTEKKYPTAKQVSTAIEILNEALAAPNAATYEKKIDLAAKFITPKNVALKLNAQLFCAGTDVLKDYGDCHDSICFKGEPKDVLKILLDRNLDLFGDEYWVKSAKVKNSKIEIFLWDGPNEMGDTQVIDRCN